MCDVTGVRVYDVTGVCVRVCDVTGVRVCDVTGRPVTRHVSTTSSWVVVAWNITTTPW